MFKRVYTALLIASISSLSYAYGINSTLTVENNTGADLLVTVEDLPYQKSAPAHVAAHTSGQINLTIGGWELYKYYSARFTVKSDDADQKLYAQGRVAYYVGWLPFVKYNFLDSVSSAQGLKLDTTYSCFPIEDGHNTFENRIVITGTPGEAMEAKPLPAEIHCHGFKSSTLSEDQKNYTPVCSNGDWGVFTKDQNPQVIDHHWAYLYYIHWPRSSIAFRLYNSEPGYQEVKNSLDAALDTDPYNGKFTDLNKFCGSW